MKSNQIDTTIRKNIQANISKYRKKSGLSQAELAQKIGVKNSTVSSWERGANAPDIETLFSIFRDYDVHSCKICRENEKSISKGETKIEKWLIQNNIKYKTQYTFEDCKHDKKLKFDFAILNNDNNVKMLIEFDGKQHFGVGLFSDDTEKMLEQYSKIKQSDETKNTYCFRKCIPLLRIPYSKYANIDKILSNSLL